MPFPDLRSRLAEIRERVAHAVARGGHRQDVSIVAVTKTFGVEAVQAAFDAGLTDIGENKVQEALGKQALVSLPVRWHLIGHLQRNKVKSLEHFHMLHALDSARLADAVDAWAQSRGASASAAPTSRESIGEPIRALMQVNVSNEDTKGGFALDDVPREAERWRAMPGLTIVGAMTMAPYDAPESVLRACFAGARRARTMLADAGHPATELSMGMSNDFDIAAEEGATLIRLGTILFGARG